MKRISTMVLALGCAALFAPQARAQSSETKTTTKVQTEHATSVKYTGCVASDPQTRTYILQNVQPVRRTQTTSFDGTTVTTTTYALVPETRIELEPQVGHTVEVTGVMVAAGHGDAKVTTRTKTDGGKEVKEKTEFERGPYPQLRVMSVKPLGGTCSVN
jgi:hypothetical protein